MYREYIFYTPLVNESISCTSTGAKLIVTTDPKMRFEFYEVVAELVSGSGITTGPTISIGVTASSYDDQVSSFSLSSITTTNEISISSAGGSSAKSIAPSTGIYVNVTTAASATTYNIRLILVGVYY